MASAKDTTPWIVARNNGATCLRCGAHRKPKLPMTTDEFTKWADAMIKAHRNCKEKRKKK